MELVDFLFKSSPIAIIAFIAGLWKKTDKNSDEVSVLKNDIIPSLKNSLLEKVEELNSNRDKEMAELKASTKEQFQAFDIQTTTLFKKVSDLDNSYSRVDVRLEHIESMQKEIFEIIKNVHGNK